MFCFGLINLLIPKDCKNWNILRIWEDKDYNGLFMTHCIKDVFSNYNFKYKYNI